MRGGVGGGVLGLYTRLSPRPLKGGRTGFFPYPISAHILYQCISLPINWASRSFPPFRSSDWSEVMPVCLIRGHSEGAIHSGCPIIVSCVSLALSRLLLLVCCYSVGLLLFCDARGALRRSRGSLWLQVLYSFQLLSCRLGCYATSIKL